MGNVTWWIPLEGERLAAIMCPRELSKLEFKTMKDWLDLCEGMLVKEDAAEATDAQEAALDAEGGDE